MSQMLSISALSVTVLKREIEPRYIANIMLNGNSFQQIWFDDAEYTEQFDFLAIFKDIDGLETINEFHEPGFIQAFAEAFEVVNRE